MILCSWVMSGMQQLSEHGRITIGFVFAVQEAACGCAGIYSAPVALALYAHAFEGAGALDQLEAFASSRGPDFYGLPRNTSTITLHKQDWTVPAEFEFGDGVVVPMWAGQTLSWQVTTD